MIFIFFLHNIHFERVIKDNNRARLYNDGQYHRSPNVAVKLPSCESQLAVCGGTKTKGASPFNTRLHTVGPPYWLKELVYTFVSMTDARCWIGFSLMSLFLNVDAVSRYFRDEASRSFQGAPPRATLYINLSVNSKLFEQVYFQKKKSPTSFHWHTNRGNAKKRVEEPRGNYF